MIAWTGCVREFERWKMIGLEHIFPPMLPILLWGRFSLKIRYLNDLKIPGAITHLTVMVDFQHLQVLRWRFCKAIEIWNLAQIPDLHCYWALNNKHSFPNIQSSYTYSQSEHVCHKAGNVKILETFCVLVWFPLPAMHDLTLFSLLDFSQKFEVFYPLFIQQIKIRWLKWEFTI